MNHFTYNGSSFLFNQEKCNIYSGSIHYFRVLPEMWEDRLSKLKAAGLNTVETYVAWNFHSQTPGHYDFSGPKDIVKFLQIAQRLGLNAIVRPGPYICAEWEFGGFPSYLLKHKDIQLRRNDPVYLKYVFEYLSALFDEIKPMLLSNGGNIIMMQIENEYGSYSDDKVYLNKLKDFYIQSGIDVLLFTSDGNEEKMLTNGTIPGILPTVNFGSNVQGNIELFRERYHQQYPFMCGEFWCGWFDHWGEKHHIRSTDSVIEEVKAFLKNDANFNFYMFFGGTNFGLTSGANCSERGFEPTVTSYDYHGLLTENGDYTETFFLVRELLHKHQGIPLEPLPPSPKTQALGAVQLNRFASLEKVSSAIGKTFYNTAIDTMENFSLSTGLIQYSFEVDTSKKDVLIKDLGDRAYVYFNHKLLHIFDRFNSLKRDFTFSLPSQKGKLTILVEAMGRVNYGPYLKDHKGISNLMVNGKNLRYADVTIYPLATIPSFSYQEDRVEFPSFCHGTFDCSQQVDTFIYLEGFKKGYVYLNGFNLGRYWELGPQKSLYVPGSLLKKHNEIVVLELEGFKRPIVNFKAKHDLGDVN